MPSGRWNGPENRRSTVRDESAGFGESGGSPGGWSSPVSWAAVASGKRASGGEGFQGNAFSSK
eukprot:4509437-Pleurochrysis_carterae.AAC.1